MRSYEGVEFVNLTAHPISICRKNNSITVIPPHPPAARIDIETGLEIGEADGVSVHAPNKYGRVKNLPPPRSGVIYIVSQLTAIILTAQGIRRTDVVYPGFNPCDQPLRDHNKRFVAVRRLIAAA